MPKSNADELKTENKNRTAFSRLLVKIMPAWITPNIISGLRLMMIPIVVAFMALGFFTVALVLFIGTALLDALDGALARARNQISDWGLILDPLADKLLIMALVAFLLLLYPFKLLIIYVFVFDLLILLVSALKISQINLSDGQKIKASNIWGKSKMLTQVIGVSLALLWLAWPVAPLLCASALIIWLSLIPQIVSAISYSS